MASLPRSWLTLAACIGLGACRQAPSEGQLPGPVDRAPAPTSAPRVHPEPASFVPHDGVDGGFRVPVHGAERVAVGDAHACVSTRAGALYCWRDPGAGSESRYGASPTALGGRIRAFAVAGDRTCAIDERDAVICLGPAVTGELDDDGSALWRESRVVPGGRIITTSTAHTCVAGANDVVCWGEADFGATAASSPEGGVVASVGATRALAAGTFGTCSASQAGALICWGAASLIAWAPSGAGHVPPSPTPPTVLRGVGDAASVSIDQGLACLTHASGRVSCWAPEDAPTLLPQNPLPGGAEVVGVSDAIRVRGSLIVRASGTLASVDHGDLLQLRAVAVLAELTHVVDADGTPERGCAVDRDGVVVCWKR